MIVGRDLSESENVLRIENLATAVLCHSPSRSGIGDGFAEPLGHRWLRIGRAIELVKKDAAHRWDSRKEKPFRGVLLEIRCGAY